MKYALVLAALAGAGGIFTGHAYGDNDGYNNSIGGSKTWATGSSGNAGWNSTPNNGDILVFNVNSTGTGTVTLEATNSYFLPEDINLDSSTGGTVNIDQNGATGFIFTSNATGYSNIQLDDNNGATFTINAPISINSGIDLTFKGSGNDNYNFAGQISDGTSGSGSITFNDGSATNFSLDGGNSYSGGTTVDAGEIQAETASALGTGNVTIDSGATVEIHDFSNSTVLNNFNIQGTGVGGEALIINNNDTVSGNITLANAATVGITDGLTATVTGTISGGHSLTIDSPGGGVFVLQASETYNGTTFIDSNATLQLGNGSTVGNIGDSSAIEDSGTLIFDSEATTTYGAVLSGAGTVIQAHDDITFSGNNTFSGNVEITSGTMNIGAGGSSGNFTAANEILDSGTLVFDTDSNTFLYSGVPISGNGAVKQCGTDTIVLADNETFTGATTISAGTLQLGSGGSTGNITGAANIVDNSDLIFDTAGSTTYTGDIISGSGKVTQSGSGTIILADDESYSGTTIISAGTLQLGNGSTAGNITNSAAIENSGTLIFDSLDQPTYNSVISGGGKLIQEHDNVTLTADNSYTGTTQLTNGALYIGAGGTGGITGSGAIQDSNTLIFDTTDTGANATYSNIISGGGALIQKDGTITLTANNSYSGNTTITASTLKIGNGGTTGSITNSGGITDNGTLVFDTATTGFAYANSISGSGAIIKSGTDTITLTANESYTGNTLISAGTLQVGSGSSGGVTGSGAIQNSGLLIFDTTDTGANATYANVVSGGGALTQQQGTLTLTGTNSYSGTTTINAATTLQIGNGGTGGSVTNSGSIVDSGSLVFDLVSGTVNLTYGNAISGSGTLTFNGGSQVVLGGNNSYTGATTVNAGRVNVNNNNAFGTSGTVTVASGAEVITAAGYTLLNNFSIAGSGTTIITADSAARGALRLAGGTVLNGSVTLTAGAAINVDSGSALIAGNVTGAQALTVDVQNTDPTNPAPDTGTLILTANNSLSGSTTIAGGVLQIGNATTTGSLTQSTGIVNNGTLVFDTATTGFTYANIISGLGALTQSGSGVITLTGNDTYTGSTTVNSGATLQIGSGSAGGNITASSSITDSGLLFFDSSTTYTYSNPMSGSGTLTFGGTDPIICGDKLFSGTVNITSTDTLQLGNGTVSGSLTNAGVINDSGSLVFDSNPTSYSYGMNIIGGGAVAQCGSDTITLSANETYTGATMVGSGATLLISGSISTSGSIADNGTLVLDSSINGLVYSNPISGSGGLTQSGSGYTVIEADNSYTGATTISSGGLQIGLGTAGGITGSTSIIDNVALNFNSTDTGANATYGGTVSGAGTVGVMGGAITLAGNNSYTGNTTISSGATLQLGSGGSSGSVTGSGGISNAGALIFDNTNSSGQSYGNLISGTGSLTVDAGSVTLSNAGTYYSGATTVNGGTLTIGGSATLASTSSVTIGAGATLNLSSASNNQLDYSASGATWTIAGTMNVTTNTAETLTSSAISSITLNGGTMTSSAANTTGFGAYLAASNLTITANGTGNTISGIGNFGLFGGSTLTLDTPLATDVLNVSTSLFNTGGTGALATSGLGTVMLTGANSYTGSTTINAGTLQIGNGGTNGSITSTSTITNNGALVFNLSSNSTYAVAITGSGSVTQSGSGTITLSSASNTYTGTTAISSGTIDLTGKLGDTAVAVNSAATLAASAGATLGASNGTSLTLLAGSTLNLQDGTVGNFTINSSAGSYSGTALSLQGATIDLDLGNSSVDDLVVANGNAVISGTNKINLSTAGDTSLTYGTYTILNVENGTKSASPVFKFANDSTSEVIKVNGTYYSLSLVDPTGSEMLDINPVTARTIISLSAVSGGTPDTFTSGQQILNHASPTTSYQGVFSTNTNALTVTGSNGNYAYQSATHINSEGTGNTASNQGNTTAYIELNGFNPASDEEIAALGIDDNGSLLTSTADGAGLSTTSIVSDINSLWDATGGSGTIAYVLAGTQYAGLFGTTQYNVYLDFTAGQLANLGLSSSGDNYLGFDFTADPNFDSSTADLTVTAVAVVPEPSSLGLMGLGVVGAATVRRRRRNRKS